MPERNHGKNDAPGHNRCNCHPEPASLGPSFRLWLINASVFEDHLIKVQSRHSSMASIFLYTIVAMSVILFSMLSNAFTRLAVPDRFQQTRGAFRHYLTGMVKKFSPTPAERPYLCSARGRCWCQP